MRRLPLLAAALLAANCSLANRSPEEMQDRPVRERDVITAIEDGVKFLVRSQNANGSWGGPANSTGYDLWSPPPGSHDAFRAATTALCVMALMEAKGPREPIQKGLEWLVTSDPPLRPEPAVIYNVWGHTYAFQALAAAYEAETDELGRARIRAAAERHLDLMKRYETAYGGWNYYDFNIGSRSPGSWPTSFGTAAALVAFFDAQRAGLDVPEDLVRRSIAAVAGCRKPDGSYLYDLGWRLMPNHPANQAKGGLGRMQSGNLALFVWSAPGVGKPEMKSGFDLMAAEHRFLEVGRKRQYPHEAFYFNSGYYYYFGHYYAARLVELLDPEDRKERRGRLASFVLPHQEEDGSWWDYSMFSYHKPYGTALALMTLLRCLDAPYRPKP
ncbi:MAG TPA: hypothetical protein VJU16_06870 [Planctomycetota bacterium]|nr:hypothetical protein [Planctomycetota bacterium]